MPDFSYPEASWIARRLARTGLKKQNKIRAMY